MIAAVCSTASSYFEAGTSRRVVMAQPWPAWEQMVNDASMAEGQVGVVEDDEGGLAAELEEHLLHGGAGAAMIRRPVGRAGERHHVDPQVGGERLSRPATSVPAVGDHVHDAGGDVGVLGDEGGRGSW